MTRAAAIALQVHCSTPEGRLAAIWCAAGLLPVNDRHRLPAVHYNTFPETRKRKKPSLPWWRPVRARASYSHPTPAPARCAGLGSSEIAPPLQPARSIQHARADHEFGTHTHARSEHPDCPISLSGARLVARAGATRGLVMYVALYIIEMHVGGQPTAFCGARNPLRRAASLPRRLAPGRTCSGVAQLDGSAPRYQTAGARPDLWSLDGRAARDRGRAKRKGRDSIR